MQSICGGRWRRGFDGRTYGRCELVDLRQRDVARERKPYAGGARGNCGRANGLDCESALLELLGDVQRHFIAAKKHGNDMAGAVPAAQIASAQLLAERYGDALQMRALGIRCAHEFERRANLSRHVRRRGCGEDKGARAIDQKLF